MTLSPKRILKKRFYRLVLDQSEGANAGIASDAFRFKDIEADIEKSYTQESVGLDPGFIIISLFKKFLKSGFNHLSQSKVTAKPV
jgi:hypothetical protein